ncbi:MAG: hypothetical protein ABIB71_00200 [Candidatus Woesearchaeota archaeon]
MFRLARCKDKGAFSAKLENPRKLNFNKLRKKYKAIADTPIVMVIKAGSFDIVVHRHGELIFKNDGDKEEMREIAGEIYENA